MFIRESTKESMSMYNKKKMNINIGNIMSCVIDNKNIVLKVQNETFKIKINGSSIVNIEYE